MILIDIEYIKELEDIDLHKEEHLNYLDDFYKKDLILSSGPYDNRQGFFIISKMDKAQAYTYIDSDPYNINGLANFHIKEFTPTRCSTEFEPIINSKNLSGDGRELFKQLHGEHAGEQLISSLSNISSDFTDLTFDFAFGQIFARNNTIPMLTKELIIVAVCSSIGDCHSQVQSHLEAALRLGATKDMIVETLLLYIGNS